MGINFSLNLYFINTVPPVVNANTLIIGDSHPQTAINPKLLNNAENLSQSAEPYFITYFKLKKLLDTNKIDTVILGYSYHNLSAFNDKKFIDSKWSNKMFQRTYPLISISELDNLETNNRDYIKILYRNMCIYPKFKHHNYLGSFKSLNSKKKIFDSKPSIKRHFFYNDTNVGTSSIAVAYLDLLIELTEQNNIKLILLGTPLHKSYLNNIPVNFKKEFEKNKHKILQEHKDIEVWDYTNEVMEDKLFIDPDHLNNNGSDLFTKLIKVRLQTVDKRKASLPLAQRLRASAKITSQN